MRTSTTRRWPVRYLWLGTLAVVAMLLQPASTAAAGRSIGQASAQGVNAIHRPQGITAGPDGALWFTNQSSNSIGRITTNGTVSSFTDKGISGPYGITTGPDGALWFTNYGNNTIGRMTTSGVVTDYHKQGVNGLRGPYAITAAGGALWFTVNFAYNAIGRITTAGKITLYNSGALSFPDALTAGPDGALWFTNGTHAIGRITTSGKIKSFSRKGVIVSPPPDGITSGPDGALWFTNYYDDSVARITTAGVVTRF